MDFKAESSNGKKTYKNGEKMYAIKDLLTKGYRFQYSNKNDGKTVDIYKRKLINIHVNTGSENKAHVDSGYMDENEKSCALNPKEFFGWLEYLITAQNSNKNTYSIGHKTLEGTANILIPKATFGTEILDNVQLRVVCDKINEQIPCELSWNGTMRIATFILSSAVDLGNDNLIEWLKSMEAPYKKEDYIWKGEITIAIKPYNSNDGYVTVGYGHAIQSDKDAKKYGFEIGSKQNVSEVNDSISKQLVNYNSYTDNPAILTLEDAEALLADDLVKYTTKAYKLASETALSFSQNEMDGITSLVYNGNHANDPDSLLYYFLRKDKTGAMNVLHKTVDNGWYGSNQGLLRRRLMEFNFFFNNDYNFYDSDNLEKLKKKVGF